MSSFVGSYFHIVFSTKDRKPLIRPSYEHDLFSYISGIGRAIDSPILTINGTANHIHLLCALHKDRTVSEAIRLIKANSSKWMGETYKGKFLWQRGYGAFSVSPSAISNVEKYIANQKEHHKKQTFEEEYLKLLKASNIPFDEKFVFG